MSESLDRVNHEYKKSTIARVGQEKPKAAKERHYVDNTKFYDELVARKKLVDEAKEKGLPLPKITDYIGLCILNIAKNLSNKYQFFSYPFKEDMIADAIEHCLRYIDSFDPNKTKNPFSYYTQTCYFSFISRISREKEQLAIKYKSMLSSAALGELAETDDNEDMAHLFDNVVIDQDYMETFVQDYDNKILKKTKDRKKKVGLEEFFEGEEDENSSSD